MNNKRIDYLIALQQELRNEVKQRVAQRDGFATQFLVGCSTVITLSLMDFPYAVFLIWLMPLVTIFFSLQILYSYVIHDNLTRFLRKHVEPELSRLLEIKQTHRHNYFWETRCAFDRMILDMRFPGIRKGFFEKIIFVAPVISTAIFIILGYFRTNENGEPIYDKIIISLFAIIGFLFFEGISFGITLKFRKTNDMELLGKRDYINISRRDYLDRAVFLDRDGTLIVDKVQPKSPEEIELFDDTISVLKRLRDKGYLLIMITNQDGIKKGKLTEQEFHSFNEVLLDDFRKEGIHIDAVYFSPHERSENNFSFKPNPGMIYLAAEDFRLDLANCYLIGDQHTDYLAGIRSGVKSFYVETGIYNDIYEAERQAFFKAYQPKRYKNLSEAEADIPSALS